MLTDEQLADQLRAQLRREVATVEPSADFLNHLHRGQSRWSLGLRVSLFAVPAVVAALIAAVLVATGGSTSPRHSVKAVLTAAMVQRMANASRVALAHSGRVKTTYQERTNGVLQESGTSDITFAGKNWNNVSSQTFPASKGQPAHTQTAINRIVDGQFYLHTIGRNGRMQWIRDTNPTGHPKIVIPDPRKLFGLLKPSAKFKIVGHRVTGGVRLTELRATRAPELPPLNGLPGVRRGAHVALFTVWVDRQHRVHQISLRVTQHQTSNPMVFKFAKGRMELLVPSKAYLKEAKAVARKMQKHYKHVTARVDPSIPGTVHHYFDVTSASVIFSDFGKREVITAPKHSVPVFGRG
ncbi:MAG: hypothetical protein ACTHJW_12455 [Streptosporangiaceae bacterium]